MIVLAIDPGPTESAWMRVNDGIPEKWAKEENETVLVRVKERWASTDMLIIEKIESFGMAVGAEVFETVFWSGRFAQAFGTDVDRVGRKDVKMHLCHSMRATDANIRCALIDKFGGKDKAIGRKKTPGPLFGIAGDCWSALAVAVTWAETKAAVTTP